MKARQCMTAIVYDKKGNVLSTGKNNYKKTHRIMYEHGCRVGQPFRVWIHAELDAILKCRDISKAHKIMVFRYDSKGNTMLAKPCKVCESIIASTGIKVIEWTTGK